MPNLPLLEDIDVGFSGMNSRIDPALLAKGLVAKAVNRRFDQSKIRNRWGVIRAAWGGQYTRGTRGMNVNAHSTHHLGASGAPIPAGSQIACNPVTQQRVFPNGSLIVADDGASITTSAEALNFTATETATYYSGTNSLGDISGILTYRDAETGSESLLVAVNTSRSSDGGQGVVYIIRPGQSYQSILSGADSVPMNGHDFYGPVKLIQASNAVVMLRPGPVRYYFTGADVELGPADSVRVHVPPECETGTKVEVARVDASIPLGSILNNTFYFARVINNDISFYSTPELAALGGPTGLVPIAPTGATNRYFVEVAESVNWWSQPSNPENSVSSVTGEVINDGPPLIMQAGPAATNPLEAGFDRVPGVLTVDSSDATAGTLTIFNHKFVPADRVQIGTTIYYVYPVDPQTIHIYDGNTGENSSLVGDATFLPVTSAFDDQTVKKSGASGASIPAGREGIYFGNRLLVIYGFDQLAVSDVLDPLHYLPLLQEFKLNTGTNDTVVAIYPFNQTTLLVFKRRSILAIQNIYGDLSNVQLVEITREFGCVSSKSIVSTGSDVVFLSTRGVASINQTEFGIQQSVVLPLSDPIQTVIDLIDQPNAANACAAYWDNRYIVSVPLKDGDGTNRLTLVYNFLNQAWDGMWQGDYLTPTQYERLDVNGTLRLAWADQSGFIHFFDPVALQDLINGLDPVDVATEIRFRAFACGVPDYKQFLEAQLGFASWSPNMTLTAVCDGIGEQTILADNWSADVNNYLQFGKPPRDPSNSNDDFLAPYRQDYSLAPGFALHSGLRVNLHQVYQFKSPLRKIAAYTQLVLQTFWGSVEVYSARMSAVPYRTGGQLDA